VTEPPLQPLIEAWLAAPPRRLNLAFPAPLELRYSRETAAARQRGLRIAALALGLTALVLTPLLWLTLPDGHGPLRHLWLQTALPACALSYLPLCVDGRRILHEALLVLCAIATLACLAVILTASPHGNAATYLATTLVVLLIVLIPARISFRLAAPFALSVVAMIAAVTPLLPYQNHITCVTLTLLTAVAGLCALFGHHRLETETRRCYALMLRARLLRQPAAAGETTAKLPPAWRDKLTGLANRAAFESWLDTAWRRAQDDDAPLGLIIVDIDRFKLYNDFYGTPAGDVCLQTVATCLREQMRGTTDLVARIAGEAFAIILPRVTLRTCGDIAERLRLAVTALDLPHFGVSTNGVLSISVGAASVPPHAAGTPRDLSAAAEQALDGAKQAGRDCVFLAEIETGGAAPAQVRRLRT
jgi:diguanylate cyclase (GGDEF)-like protein